jgi:hypothetical protein
LRNRLVAAQLLADQNGYLVGEVQVG